MPQNDGVMFVVRIEVVKKVIDDPVWYAKLRKCRTNAEAETVFRQFCNVKKIKVATV